MPDRNDVLKLMDESDAVYLATVGDGGPTIRALVNLRRADRYPDASKIARAAGFTAFLSTSLDSTKIRDIRANPVVSLYYCDPARFLGATLNGRAEVVDDPALKKALWSWDWRVYYPRGADDPNYVIVRVVTETVIGWWRGQPYRLDEL